MANVGREEVKRDERQSYGDWNAGGKGGTNPSLTDSKSMWASSAERIWMRS